VSVFWSYAVTTRYCTYFDKNYLPRGFAMIDSLLAHDPADRITVLSRAKSGRTIER
jgi:hypothetical protein